MRWVVIQISMSRLIQVKASEKSGCWLAASMVARHAMLEAYVGVSCFKLLVIEEMRISGVSEKFQGSRDWSSSFM